MLTQVEYLSRDAWILFICIYNIAIKKTCNYLMASCIDVLIFNYLQVWSVKMFLVI